MPIHMRTPTFKQWFHIVPWGIVLLAGILPMWVSSLLPFTDMPQHLYLISALGHLKDPATLYPEYFEIRHAFTSYLGYYYAVDALSTFMSVDTANRIFLSLYVISLPLSVAFLLRSFKRPTWPALLTIPFAYGDPISWGFINSSVAFPIAIFTAGCFVRCIEDASHRLKWAIWTAVLLMLVLIFHVLPFAFLALALPFLLLTSSAPEGGHWPAKRAALLSVVPGVAIFLFWMGSRFLNPSEGIPRETPNTAEISWQAAGSFLSTHNFRYSHIEYTLKRLFVILWREAPIPRFSLFASFIPGPLEHLLILLVLLVALAATILSYRNFRGAKPLHGGYRLFGLAGISFLLYLSLPFHLRGYIYVLNPRYAPYIAVFLMASLPALPALWQARAPWISTVTVLPFFLLLAIAFQDFDAESRELEAVAKAAPPRVKVMGLIFNSKPKFLHPHAFLHAASEVARRQGGMANFTFALTPQSPLMYRISPPPTFRNEWEPSTMDWEEQGSYYDCFLVRGTPTVAVAITIDKELALRKQQGSFSLYCRKELELPTLPEDDVGQASP